MKLLRMLSGIVELLRPHNLVVAALTTLIGYTVFVSAYWLPLQSMLSIYAKAASIVVLVAAGGYVINDYYDVETDAVVKPWRPIPSGRVSRPVAAALAWGLIAAGLAVAATMGFLVFVFVAVNTLLVYEYSRWIKRTGFIGNIVVAFNSAASIVLGGLAPAAVSGLPLPIVVLVPAAIAFILVLGREIVKGIEDYEGDLKACYMTLAVRLGPRRAARIAALILTIVVALSPLPLILAPYTLVYAALAAAVDIMVAYTITVLLKTQSDREAIHVAPRLRSVLKVSFLLGALAFLLGVPLS